jgi:ribonuclease I
VKEREKSKMTKNGDSNGNDVIDFFEAKARIEKAKNGKGPDKYILELSFSQTACQRLNEMQIMAGTQSYIETVRSALKFYAWFLSETSQGHKILVKRNQDEVVEIEFEF